MDTLVALSTGIAFLFSAFNTFFPEFLRSHGLIPHVYYEAAAVIIAFILLGKYLEERAKSATSSAIKKLIGLQPKTVRIIRDEIEQEIPVSEVIVDDIVVVRSGEKIPVDGEVVEGTSFIDESMISGEPIPLEKKTGDKVFAGTINQKGSFQFKAEKVGGDTLLSQIINMVKEAQGNKAPVQKLVDKIAGIFVPVVLIISILSLFIWFLAGDENAVGYGIMAMITVLIIACPCALGLATPTAIMVGVGKGAEQGILIKDAESLETAHKVNAVLLDKTGTITEGKPEVNVLIWANENLDKEYLINVLLTIERQSEHPLADSVIKYLEKEKTKSIVSKNFQSLTGLGVTAQINNSNYFIGSRKLMESQNVQINEHLKEQVRKLQAKANTIVYFGDEKECLAIFSIADKIKPNSKAAVSELQKMGVDVYMLTGDNKDAAAEIAKSAGIKHYEAEMLPSDKAEFVKKLQNQGKIVAMVGDGINDSHALAQADVSIAMGKGSDIAIDVAKMTIISSDLMRLPKALRVSGFTVKTIKQNLFWAFIYNVTGIPIAAGVLYPALGFLLDPMIAGAAMAFSSVSVVANSLRLRGKRI